MTLHPGQRVRIADRTHDGHHRTPGYLKGKVGVVAREHGAFTNPETSAYGASGAPERPLYLVGFAQDDVWPAYGGVSEDRIYADLYEHWLEEVE
jgi:hypothetical protein